LYITVCFYSESPAFILCHPEFFIVVLFLDEEALLKAPEILRLEGKDNGKYAC
jgi:hypothetical protein